MGELVEDYQLGALGLATAAGFTDPLVAVPLTGAGGTEAAAEGRFVHVYVDNTHGAGSRPVTPIPDVVREAVVRLLP